MSSPIRRYRPTPSTAYLGNPHKGCCTFQHFNGDPLFDGTTWSEEGPTVFPAQAGLGPLGCGCPGTSALARPKETVDGYLPSTVSYCRWFWRLMEPGMGVYDFSVLDKALATAASRGQTLAIRLQPFGAGTQPQLPEWYRKDYPTTPESFEWTPEYQSSGIPFYHPIYGSPEYYRHFGGFIREAGRRYDGNPILESVDVAYEGPWGEGAGTATPDVHREFQEIYKQAWPTTPRLSLIDEEQMEAGIPAGTGWRLDCLGNVGTEGSDRVLRHESWNHHFTDYPKNIATFASESWKRTPVHLETCWVPMHWYRKGWDLDFILEQALKYHATYFMPKYTRLPDAWLDKLAAFSRRIGYRFVLRQAQFDLEPKRDGALRIQCWIDNVGVAPIYRRYTVALRLRQGGGAAIIPLTDVDLRTWMPGDTWLDRTVALPPDIQPGYAELAIGILNPTTLQPSVRFAVKEQFSDGWATLEAINIQA